MIRRTIVLVALLVSALTVTTAASAMQPDPTVNCYVIREEDLFAPPVRPVTVCLREGRGERVALVGGGFLHVERSVGADTTIITVEKELVLGGTPTTVIVPMPTS